MAFCSNCGSAISEGAVFCSVCGSPVAAAGERPAAPEPGPAAGAGMSSNVAAALSYLLWFITAIIFLVIEPYKNDKFVRFHAFQSIAFSVVVLVVQIVWSIIVSIGFLSLGLLVALVGLVGVVLWLAIVGYWIFLMYKAYNNERYMIPVIGEWALKQAGS